MLLNLHTIETAIRENLIGIDEEELTTSIQNVIRSVRKLILQSMIHELPPGDIYQYCLYEKPALPNSTETLDSVTLQMKRQVHLIITFRAPLTNRYLQLLQESYGQIIVLHLPAESFGLT